MLNSFSMSLQHTEPQEVELPFRNLADACLFRVDRQLQVAHELAHPMQCFSSLASSAQDHEIVGIGHDPTAEALPQSELLPSQHKPAHVQICYGVPLSRPMRLPSAICIGAFSHLSMYKSAHGQSVCLRTARISSSGSMLSKEAATDYPSPGFPRFGNYHPRGPSF